MIRSSEDAIRGTEPVELTVQILGTSPHPAQDVSIRLEHTDGHPSPVIAERPAWISPSGGRARYPLGLVPRRTPEPDLNVEGTPSELIFRFILRFSDQGGFVTWEQHGEVYEIYDVRPTSVQPGAPLAPRFGYEVRASRPPIVMSTTDSPPRPVGLVRRTARRFWHWLW